MFLSAGFLDLYVYAFGVRFHAYTAILIALTWFASLWVLRRERRLNALVVSTAACAFAVHAYEWVHASFEYGFTGTTGLSVLTINIPSVILSLLVILRFVGLKPRLVLVFSTLIGLGVIMGIMGVEGFFRSLDYSPAWAASKICASLLALEMVQR